MFHLRGHRQRHRADGVVGGAQSVGCLFCMSATLQTLTTRTLADLHIELGDDRHNRRQIGLVLHDDALLDELFATAGAMRWCRHVDDACDLLRRWRGALAGLVAWFLA